jgi:hypothetical protein
MVSVTMVLVASHLSMVWMDGIGKMQGSFEAKHIPRKLHGPMGEPKRSTLISILENGSASRLMQIAIHHL